MRIIYPKMGKDAAETRQLQEKIDKIIAHYTNPDLPWHGEISIQRFGGQEVIMLALATQWTRAYLGDIDLFPVFTAATFCQTELIGAVDLKLHVNFPKEEYGKGVLRMPTDKISIN